MTDKHAPEAARLLRYVLHVITCALVSVTLSSEVVRISSEVSPYNLFGTFDYVIGFTLAR